MFPLHIRSYYSLMHGTMSPAEICSRAKKFGYRSIALTDYNNLYGLWSFLSACRREGLKSIIGCELGVVGSGKTVTCLVRNEKGYANLCLLISLFHTAKDFDLQTSLSRYAEGLVILSQNLELLKLLCSNDVQPFADLGPRPTEQAFHLKKWAEKNGVAAVATHDSGVAGAEDAETYVLLQAIAGNSSISAAREQSGRRVNYFERPATYQERFAMWPGVIEQGYQIARQCHFSGPDFGLVMPPWDGGDARTMLRQRAYRGARHRYGDDLGEKVVDRLEHELQIIESMGFSSYFLVVRDIVCRRGADGKRRKRRICGRGSGAASLVAYCLEITNVCPIKYNLYFERFLNPGRSDPPDIDIDFAWDERDEVLEEVLSDYKDHAAMVSSHIRFQPRMAVRETAKAYGMPGYEISRISKKIPWLPHGKTPLLKQLETSPALRGENLTAPWPEIINLAEKIISIPRHLSVHPGGVIITPDRITNYVPVEKAAKGVPLIQWEKDGAEEAGLVKIDLLGNRSLGVIRDCLVSVEKPLPAEGKNWQPEDDPRTKDAVAHGATMGCFYIESPAMRLLQQKAASGSYEQLVIQSSIIRPAANEFVREYVRRLHGGKWQPLHHTLTNVLDETFGLMVYQEDVSRVAVHLAGFSHVKADGLRKVMSKKDKEHVLADYREEFFQGCLQNQLNSTEIEAIWEMMMSFSGYSFCKPHSASYARVSFQAAYLKTHFPAEFMAAVIANHGGYYSTFAYVSEAKRCGVKIFYPDVNVSEKKWLGRNMTMRTGLQAIHGLSAKLIERIIENRRQDGRYRSPVDFLGRTRPAEDEARQLIHAGALDSLQKKVNRTALLWELASFLRIQQSGRQIPMFTANLPKPPQLKAPSVMNMYRREYEALGFLCQTHPVVLLQKNVGKRVKAKDLKKHIGQRIRFLGWLLTGKLVSTKTGEAMEFLTFEDECGIVETTFFPKIYRKYAHLLSSGKPYLLHGQVDVDFGALTLTVERVEGVGKLR